MKLKDLSKILNGTVFGDPETEITGISGIEEAERGDITFLSSGRLLNEIRASKASVVIVREAIPDLGMAQLLVPNPQYAFAKALEIIRPAREIKPGISGSAIISQSASIGADVTVMPFAFISDGASLADGSVIFPGVFIGPDSRIGKECVIYPNVTIMERVIIGDRVRIHSGAVIGADGFGYIFEAGEHYKIPQVGGVIIGSDVEIGSNVSIDRATTGNTIIGEGTKIDNLVQIAHNVKIGPKSIIVSQVGIAGSSELGSFVTLGGQVGVADHTLIDSGTMAGAQSGLMGHLKRGVYSGSPAIPHKDWLRSVSLFSRLPEMHKKIRELEAKINTLEKGDAK